MARPILANTYLRPLSLLLTAMYVAGAIGLALPGSRTLFLQLTPLHLLSTTALVLLAHPRPSGRFWLSGLLVAILGFAAEWLGVHSGLVFGHYYYGPALGWKLNDIPLLIGVNWLLLIYATSSALTPYLRNIVWRALAGSLLLVALDGLIEPSAPELLFWEFSGGLPGLHNYLGWLVVSFLLLLLFNYINRNLYNPLANLILILQFAFFSALLMLL